jgi:hypothetical protein
MLFERASLERITTRLDDAVVRDRAEFIAFWRDHMLALGTQMTVLLLPDKVSIYGPEIGIKTQTPTYLNRLERELSKRGIPVSTDFQSSGHRP